MRGRKSWITYLLSVLVLIVAKSPAIQRVVKTGHILHVEDDDNDVFFLTLAAEDAGISNPIDVARDGREAIDYFKSALTPINNQDAVLPCLALLDVKLPVVTGLEVLRWIRQQPGLNQVPVLMLSAAEETAVLRVCFQNGADAYFLKPCNLRERVAFVKRLKAWIQDQGDLPSSPEWTRNRLEAAVSFDVQTGIPGPGCGIKTR